MASAASEPPADPSVQLPSELWTPWQESEMQRTESQLRVLRDFLNSSDRPTIRLFRRLFNQERSAALLESVIDELTALEQVKLFNMVTDSTLEVNCLQIALTGVLKRKMRQFDLLERPLDALLRRTDAELSAVADLSRLSIPDPFTSENLFDRLARNVDYHQHTYMAITLLWTIAVLITFPAHCAPLVITVAFLYTFRSSIRACLGGSPVPEVALSFFNISIFLLGAYLTGLSSFLYFVIGLSSLCSVISMHAIFMTPRGK